MEVRPIDDPVNALLDLGCEAVALVGACPSQPQPYMKSAPAFHALVPSVVVTNRLQVPDLAPPPVVAVISVDETTLTLVRRNF